MFWLGELEDHTHDGPCEHCGGHHSWGTLEDMAFTCTTLTAQRTLGAAALGDVSLVVRDAANLHRFAEMELEAALALAEDALSLVPEIEAIILPTLREAMRPDEVYEAMAAADALWRRSSFKKGTASIFAEAMTLAVATGVVDGGNNTAKVDALFRNRIIDGMNRAAKYYSNNFFNRQVMPSLYNAVDRAIAGDTPGSVAGFRFVQTTLNTRLKSVPYWNIVANAAASRSYHYGMTRAAVATGKRYYRFNAVMDFRTSAICRFMHGREWAIDAAIDIMDSIAMADSPEDVKEIAPWPKVKDFEGKSDAELRDLGAFIPPLHPLCRSTIEIF